MQEERLREEEPPRPGAKSSCRQRESHQAPPRTAPLGAWHHRVSPTEDPPHESLQAPGRRDGQMDTGKWGERWKIGLGPECGRGRWRPPAEKLLWPRILTRNDVHRYNSVQKQNYARGGQGVFGKSLYLPLNSVNLKLLQKK